MSQVLLPGDHLLSNGTRAVDLTQGGQNGAMMDPSNWNSSAYYTKQKLICVLIQAPKAFKYLPNGTQLKQQLKAMLEKHPRSITGIDSSLTVEVNEVALGNSGKMMQTPNKVTTANSVPSFIHDELKGKPFYNLNKTWIKELLPDGNTGFPGLISQQLYIDDGSPELLPEDYAAVVLFIEPSANFQTVQEAWLSANFFPLGAENTGTREMGGAAEGAEVTTEYSALTDDSDPVRKMAQDYLDSINKFGMRPSALAAYVNEMEPVLNDDVTPEDTSFRNNVNKLAESISSKGTSGTTA